MTDEMLEVVKEEFGGGLVGRAAKTGAKSMMTRIEDEMRIQGEIVVEYAIAKANCEDNLEPYEQRFLQTNPVYRRYDGNRESSLKADLLSHFREVGSDLAPLVASDYDDFWAALHNECNRTEAETMIDQHFSQSETFMEYSDGVFSSQRIANKVINVIDEGERRLQRDLFEKLDRVYDD